MSSDLLPDLCFERYRANYFRNLVELVQDLLDERDEEPPKIDTPYLNVEEAAAYCRVAVQTIYNHRREIARQPGVGKLVFKREDLDKWLATRKRKR
jgi:hypothetical protein